jgi:hypothetical protein
LKRLALTFLLIGNLAANQALAEDVLPQPLTRAECDKAGVAWDENANVCGVNPEEVAAQPLTRFDCTKAGMEWNDNAHVCGTSAEAAETIPKAEQADPRRQPLTLSECRAVGMSWNDNTHVCEDKSDASKAQATASATEPVASSIRINIDKSKQKMTVFLDGVGLYDWPISTGRPGYATPSGTYTASSMNKIWYSKQWDNAPMPHAVFFTKDGHAIHGTYEVKRLGKPASHGCVRLAPKNAAILFDLVAKTGLPNTEVVLVGLTPGGEHKLTGSVKSKRRSTEFVLSEPFAQTKRRGGLFRRLFRGP